MAEEVLRVGHAGGGLRGMGGQWCPRLGLSWTAVCSTRVPHCLQFSGLLGWFLLPLLVCSCRGAPGAPWAFSLSTLTPRGDLSPESLSTSYALTFPKISSSDLASTLDSRLMHPTPPHLETSSPSFHPPAAPSLRPLSCPSLRARTLSLSFPALGPPANPIGYQQRVPGT